LCGSHSFYQERPFVNNSTHKYLVYITAQGTIPNWRKTGVWEQLNTALREAVREQEEREAEPSAAIMDSQSVKSTAVAGERGYDAAKKVTGRKRHILVDVLGLLLTVVVTKASMPERKGAKMLLKRALDQHFQRLVLIWADGGYTGQDFCDWVVEHC